MNIQSLIETLNIFIRECEAETESLSLQIREETNFEGKYHKEIMEQLSDEWDETQYHLENLKIIRSLIQSKL